VTRPSAAFVVVRHGDINPLKYNNKKSARNWALQRFFRPADHLALEFTRYAHYYPQHLWKTAARRAEEVPGKP
jgi:hypothetical protein